MECRKLLLESWFVSQLHVLQISVTYRVTKNRVLLDRTVLIGANLSDRSSEYRIGLLLITRPPPPHRYLMAHKDQPQQPPPTLFTDPAMTLLEVKMKLRTALRVVGRFFVPPSSHRTKHGGLRPTPSRAESLIPPSGNKLRKRHQHYHLIRKSTDGVGWGRETTSDAADHVRVELNIPSRSLDVD